MNVFVTVALADHSEREAPPEVPRWSVFVCPSTRFKLALAGSPRITRGRRGWLGPTPWRTCTSYSLASLLGARSSGSWPTGPEVPLRRQLNLY